MADGETYQQALPNAEVIIQDWIKTAKEIGRDIPDRKGRFVHAWNEKDPVQHLTDSHPES